ncbi:hypothetical protein D3C72_2246730 [compost metagenome]
MPTPKPPNTSTNTIQNASKPKRRLRSITESDTSEGLTQARTVFPSRSARSSRVPSC